MKVIQMTLDEKLVTELDKITHRLKTTRSAFTRRALRREIDYVRELDLEKKQIAGYEKKPVKKREFDDWENEQIWPD